MVEDAVLETQLPGVRLFKRGKVRDVYELGGQLLIVATDRLSAFDVVLPTGIPQKGAVLTQLSAFWFQRMTDLIPSHFISAKIDRIIADYPILKAQRAMLAGRAMLVERTEVVPIECVVRGYLAGSGWKEYQNTRAVCGITLPTGLAESQELPEPIFTPATKAETGHDLNISEAEMAARVGAALTKELKSISLSIYSRAREYARSRGILIADTKFEFGLANGRVTLVDEVLTPDSSRFWPAEDYAPGRSPVSFDKQFVRDYLDGLRWDKTPPGPALPDDIVQKTSAKYLQALSQLTGKTLAEWLGG